MRALLRPCRDCISRHTHRGAPRTDAFGIAGRIAALHPSVDTAVLYKHVSGDLLPVVRMQQLLAFCTQRRLDQTAPAKGSASSTGASSPPMSDTVLLGKGAAAPRVNVIALTIVPPPSARWGSCRARGGVDSARRAVEALLRDLQHHTVNVSWYQRPVRFRAGQSFHEASARRLMLYTWRGEDVRSAGLQAKASAPSRPNPRNDQLATLIAQHTAYLTS